MSKSETEHLYTQKLFPIVNNADHLDFRILPNPKGHIDLSNVLLHFTIIVPHAADHPGTKMRGQNYVGPKQFSSVEIRINGESVTRRSCANEYFLSSYFQYSSNYSIDYQVSACRPVGIFDPIAATTTKIVSMGTATKSGFEQARTSPGGTAEYEILMPIDSTIFYSNDLVPSNTAIDISFERTTAKLSCVAYKNGTESDWSIDLKDVYLTVPFKRSPALFEQERIAMTKPIKIKYDDYVIRRYNIPKGSKNIMLSNLISGPLPEKLFWGIQTMDSYSGSFHSSSTLFNRQGMIRANLYRDGKEVDDYPINMTSSHVIEPFVKYLDNTNQQLNGFLSRTLCDREFENYHFLLSKSFNPNEIGTLSFEFDFESDVSEDFVLITCALYNKTLKLDNHRNFQII